MRGDFMKPFRTPSQIRNDEVNAKLWEMRKAHPTLKCKVALTKAGCPKCKEYYRLLIKDI